MIRIVASPREQRVWHRLLDLAEVEARWRRIPFDSPAPAADAARSGQRVVLRSIEERDARYPHLRGRASAGEAFLTAPLVVHGRTIGVIGLGFERASELDEETLAFIDAAVAQCAAAMHRALVVESQQRSLVTVREAARRLTALQRLTSRLADVRGIEAIVEAVVDEATASVGSTQLALSRGLAETTAGTGVENSRIRGRK